MNYYDGADKNLYDRQKAWAKSLRGLLDEADRILDIVQPNDLTNHVEWVAREAATANDRTNEITLMLHLKSFVDGSSVTQLDRRGVLSAFTVSD